MNVLSRIRRRLTNIALNGWFWMLDYVYVSYWQVHGLFIRADPIEYLRTSGDSKSLPVIILIPGVYENWQFMKPVAEMLFREGYSVHIVTDLKRTTDDVEVLAEKIQNYIQKQDISDCILVAHSKGGLVGKYLLMNNPDSKAIRGLVALNTPFAGSRYAYLIPTKTVRIFLPNSPIITKLSQNLAANMRITSLYGLFDPHVPTGSYLESATNTQLPVRGHFRVIHLKPVQKAILDAVKSFSLT